MTETCHGVTGQLSQAWAGLQSPGKADQAPGHRGSFSAFLSTFPRLRSALHPRAALPHALWTDIKVTWLLLSPGHNLELVTDINSASGSRWVMVMMTADHSPLPGSCPRELSSLTGSLWFSLALTMLCNHFSLQTEPRRTYSQPPTLVTRDIQQWRGSDEQTLSWWGLCGKNASIDFGQDFTYVQIPQTRYLLAFSG